MSAEEVLHYFDGRIAAVLDGGPATLGAASTVVLVAGAEARVLREGPVTRKQIEQAVGRD
jgi:L-threonylcarbamoyladenylate synthase